MKKITIKKIVNIADRMQQKKFNLLLTAKKFDKIQRQVLPRKALFNVSNTCTSNCVFCAYQYYRDPVTIMSNDLFGLCCQQFASLQPNSWVSLTPIIGEPFTDRGLFKKIEIAKKCKVKRIETYSNASLLKTYYNEILESPLDEIYISFPDFNEEEYKIIFRTNLYKISIEGIYELLKKHKKKDSSLLVRLNLRGRKSLSAINEEPDFIKYVKPFLSNKVTMDVTKKYDNWGGLIKQDDLPIGMQLAKDVKNENQGVCLRLFKVMFLSNGDVKLCGCRCKETIFDDLVVGNIYKDSLEAIWFNEHVYELRNKFFRGEYPDICVNCTHYKKLSYDYFKNNKKIIS